MADTRINIRVDKELKEKAESLFEHLGLNTSTAINVFLRKAVEEQEIPFRVSTNALNISNAYTSAEVTNLFQETVREEVKHKYTAGEPVAMYDSDINKAYLRYADGTKEYI